MTEGPNQADGRKAYPAEKARQGQIVLNTRTRRAIFIAGLAGIVVLLAVIGLAS